MYRLGEICTSLVRFVPAQCVSYRLAEFLEAPIVFNRLAEYCTGSGSGNPCGDRTVIRYVDFLLSLVQIKVDCCSCLIPTYGNNDLNGKYTKIGNDKT